MAVVHQNLPGVTEEAASSLTMQLLQTQVKKGHISVCLPVQDFLVLLSRSRITEGGNVKGLIAPESLALSAVYLSASARSNSSQ